MKNKKRIHFILLICQMLLSFLVLSFGIVVIIVKKISPMCSIPFFVIVFSATIFSIVLNVKKYNEDINNEEKH